jgi:hypothetical protein
MGLVSYGLIANWYVMPALRVLPRERALVPLLMVHTFRFIGLAFLIPGVTSQALDPRFAQPAAYGDLLAAVLALVAVFAWRRGWRSATLLTWVFNVEGTLDLLNALTQGARFIEDGMFGATFFIPAVVVPALLVSHVLIFIILLRGEPKISYGEPEGTSPVLRR